MEALALLYLVQSNKMEILAGQLCQAMAVKSQSAQALFQPQVVWVQSPGMAQWLKLQVAEHAGIAANLTFPLPSSYIWQLYRQLLPDIPESSAFTKDNMTWKLMALLPQLCSQDVFAPVADYLAGDGELKQFQLAQKVADLFDQYLVYRPDWILAWEQGDDAVITEDMHKHAWQSALWRELVAYSKILGESPWHRANLHQALLDTLNEQDCWQKLPSQLMVFGISALPPQQLQVLQALAQQIPVYLYWLNPSCHYWGDIIDQKGHARGQLVALEQQNTDADYLDVGNPLLASWGKQGQDFLDLLLQLEPQQQDLFVQQVPDTLLLHLQDEVLELTHRGSAEPLAADELVQPAAYPKVELKGNDNSLQVVSCHSRLRELEVLQDNLLDYFRHNPQAHPGDVIVMMPDVSDYAPLIPGVFGAHKGERNIPFAISDRGAMQESPLLISFSNLMRLQLKRLSLTEILDILEVPAVMRRFALAQAEFEQLRFWLADAGIRWGLDAEDKSRWQLPQEGQNSWLQGLIRLISGYAMSVPLYHGRSSEGKSEPGTSGLIAPYADMEGQDSRILAKLLDFLRELGLWLEFCQYPRALKDKVAWLDQHLENIYAAEEDEEPYLLRLRQALESLARHQNQYDGEIEQRVFCQALEQQLQESGVGQRFLAGAVNFCTLMPMRSIPFKRVCLLGMNDSDYPRQMMPMGFDLMGLTPQRKGDRSRRLDDRYLFLEALLSARDAVYISYLGRSQRDNSVQVPSVLVEELLDYCEQVYAAEEGSSVRERLHQQAHLQPFHPQYFSQDPGRSYDPQSLNLARLLGQPATSQPFFTSLQPVEPQSQVSTEDWLRFFRNPALGFFQLRWQARFASLEQQLEDEEPFALDGLSRYQLRQRLVEAEDMQGCFVQMRAEGVLPVGNSAGLTFNQVRQDSEALNQRLAAFRREHSPHRVLLELEIDGLLLQGVQDHLYQDQLVLWRSGKVREQDKLDLWLRLLLLRAQQEPVTQAVFVGTESDPFVVAAPDPQQAQDYLQQFVAAWRSGHSRPLPLLIASAWCWLKTGDKDKTLSTYVGNDFKPGEGQEQHIARIWPDLEAVFDEFADVSEKLVGPLYAGSEA
ncbi:RecBCD enzyme subunit RecC [Lacimicrobium alkaliphilum]|uniref:RecBCD enzyme subunit RecC n=1 Tax=Lacimicrobium alkaliphilum TaxID=1526571 RepID=A0ABQ1R389_9ALTE|nr:RecBCD enzyme subunit RecC [Lacimicrobium alkaliphilum]